MKEMWWAAFFSWFGLLISAFGPIKNWWVVWAACISGFLAIMTSCILINAYIPRDKAK